MREQLRDHGSYRKRDRADVLLMSIFGRRWSCVRSGGYWLTSPIVSGPDALAGVNLDEVPRACTVLGRLIDARRRHRCSKKLLERHSNRQVLRRNARATARFGIRCHSAGSQARSCVILAPTAFFLSV